MDAILPYLINTVLGAGGAWLTNMLKKNNLGMVANLLSGAVGGNVLPLIVSALMSGGGENMIVNAITALLGGGLGSLVGGLLKKAPAT
jgi:hypothetical protein